MKKKLFYALMIGLGLTLTYCADEEVATPMAYFEVASTTVNVGDELQFNNLSTDAESYGWNFGDGSNSVSFSPVHKYTTSGNYTVSLTAYNKSKTDEFTSVITVIGGTQGLTACFTASNLYPLLNTEVTFNSNCSVGADSYYWEFGDGNTSNQANPVHSYSSIGTFKAQLTVYRGSETNYVSQNILVRDESSSIFDPYKYESVPLGGWEVQYYTEYSDPNNEDWTTGTTADYSAVIADGTYSIENFSYESGWFFWTNSAEMPNENADFDIDILYQIVYDDSTYGDGTFWGLDNSNGLEYFYYRYTHYENAVWYIYGDSEIGSWADWQDGGNYQDYNLLSIRKYQDKYYIFMNGAFISEHAFKNFYGTKFGFYIAKRSKMEIDEYGIHKMIFSSKKSASHKTKIPTQSNGKGAGAMKQLDLQKLK